MDASGNIYEIPEEELKEMTDKIREDSARLDGYLRGRSEEQTLQKLTPKQRRRQNKKNNKKKKHGRQ